MGFQESMMNFQWRSKGFWAVLGGFRSIPEGEGSRSIPWSSKDVPAIQVRFRELQEHYRGFMSVPEVAKIFKRLQKCFRELNGVSETYQRFLAAFGLF